MPATDYTETDVEKEGFSVRVEAPELCPRYSAHYVYDVKIGESPAWMKRRLALVGMSAISNVVDITNYVLKRSASRCMLTALIWKAMKSVSEEQKKMKRL